LDLGSANEEVLFNPALVCLLLNGWPTTSRTASHSSSKISSDQIFNDQTPFEIR